MGESHRTCPRFASVRWFKVMERGKNEYLVFIILRNAPTELRRVTIWALPVYASVTVITGQENARKASNDSKR